MKVLVAGIGNIFLGDDGFGVEVVRHIDSWSLPDEVRNGVTICDFGIRGVHLSYELLNGYDALILIDAMPLGEAPGTVVTFEPDVESVDPSSVDAHSMNPAVVLGLLCQHGRPRAAGRRRRLPTIDDRRGHRPVGTGAGRGRSGR